MADIANIPGGRSRAVRPIVDKTGLEGRFDFGIEFTPETFSANPDVPTAAESAGPTFDQALKAQMGLKLESQKGSIRVLRLDHIEHPSGN